MISIKPLILTVFIATAIARGDELTCDCDYTQKDKWCYKLMDAVDDITTADQNCREKGGNLVSIHSSKESAFLISFGVDLLIGLQYDTEAKKYSWTDGTPFDMKNWDAGYPMDPVYFGICVVLQKSGTWINYQCNWKSQYVCKKPISSHQCPVVPNNQLFNSGKVSSPGYPGNYISGLSCSYMLIVKDYHTVTFKMIVNEMGVGDTIEIFSRLVADNAYRIAVINSSSGLTELTTPEKENAMLVKFSSKSKTGGFWKFNFHSSTCESGWIYGGAVGLDYCYKAFTAFLNFTDAMSVCKRERAQLISIHNAFQNKFIDEKFGEEWMWLGLVKENGSWKWTDGSDVEYTNWESGEPVDFGQSAIMGNPGRWWADVNDSLQHPACYK